MTLLDACVRAMDVVFIEHHARKAKEAGRG